MQAVEFCPLFERKHGATVLLLNYIGEANIFRILSLQADKINFIVYLCAVLIYSARVLEGIRIGNRQ